MNELQKAVFGIFSRVKSRMQNAGYHVCDRRLWNDLCKMLTHKTDMIWIYNPSLNRVDVFRKGSLDTFKSPNKNSKKVPTGHGALTY